MGIYNKFIKILKLPVTLIFECRQECWLLTREHVCCETVLAYQYSSLVQPAAASPRFI